MTSNKNNSNQLNLKKIVNYFEINPFKMKKKQKKNRKLSKKKKNQVIFFKLNI